MEDRKETKSIQWKGDEKEMKKSENGITLIALIITIIILVILAAVSIRAVYNMGIVGHAINGTQQYAERAKEENEMLDQTVTKLEDAVSKVKEIQNGASEGETRAPGIYEAGTKNSLSTWNELKNGEDSLYDSYGISLDLIFDNGVLTLMGGVNDNSPKIDIIISDEVTEIAEIEIQAEFGILYIPKSVISFSSPLEIIGLNEINYAGTIEQWNAISKPENWNEQSLEQSSIKKIKCSNGNIDL